ncbi:MAG TPA: VCBS repeat-containing protein, partial [Chthonomonadaceae bacterium]|nr:VCBS repeat-containing protein [Chthonomonadaceae bacterium]
MRISHFYDLAVETAAAKARSRPAPTQNPVREGGLCAFAAANSFAGQKRRAAQAARSILLTALLACLPGCSAKAPTPPPAHVQNASASSSASALFTDVAPRAGITFTHLTGGTGKYYFIENTPGGCAFLDYDNDGFQDIFLVQSGSSEPAQTVKDRPHCALYHNNGDGTFADVTVGSGFDRDLGYMQGVTVGDYDNDGFPDIFLSGYGGNHLFHNQKGSGKFSEVTRQMGLDNAKGYATSAAFGDYDNDGRLDLYVCYYVPWTPQTNIPCKVETGLDYCSPELYDPETHHLYHNAGQRFVDVSEKAGITRFKGRGLSVAFVDYDNDGKQDIFVANDLTPNMLWHNNGNGTFTNVAVKTGCAYDESGAIMAGMGIGIADYDHSGYESFFVGNFSDKPNMLFKNVGGRFQDASYASGLALPHMKFLTFGCEFLDYDNDGWPDLFVVNGHVQTSADVRLEGITYKERKQLFHNAGNGTFTEITAPGQLGDLAVPTVGRGLAIGDYDNDG